MKEKFDVSLDNRHVVSLLIAGMVVFGAVFLLGVVVGKKLSGNERAAHAPDLLSALDEKAAAVEAKDSAFTFHEELTKKASPASDSSKTIPPKPAPVEPSGASREEGAGDKETQAAEAVHNSAARPPAESDSVAAPPAPKVQAAPAKEPTRTLPRLETTPVAARVGAKERSLREVMARVERKPNSVSESPTPFTLQLSATQSRSEADRFAARLKSKGYAPIIVPAEVPGRGKWYRVRLGHFPTKEAASRYLADFRRETRLDAFVTSN